MATPTEAQRAVYDELRRAFPWLDSLGLDPAWVQNLIATSAGAAEIAAQIRQTQQYKNRFPGLIDQKTGQQRMTEAQYIQREQEYRQLLRQYGQPVDASPASLVGFFNGEIDPNELRDRLEVYTGVVRSAQPVKDAFYVYAGIRLTDEQLYRAVVDPNGYGNDLAQYFQQETARSPIDYATYVQRATELGLEKVVSKLQELQQQGVSSWEAISKIRQLDPDFARSVMDQIFTGGTPDAPILSLHEALEAFEFAAIGGAATQAGLEMPTLERLREIRSYGQDRARMIEAYQAYGPNANLYSSAVQRARGQMFGQRDFEDAAFLGNADAQRALQSGLASEKAAGMDSGQFSFDRNQSGRFFQTGFQRRF